MFTPNSNSDLTKYTDEQLERARCEVFDIISRMNSDPNAIGSVLYNLMVDALHEFDAEIARR